MRFEQARSDGAQELRWTGSGERTGRLRAGTRSSRLRHRSSGVDGLFRGRGREVLRQSAGAQRTGE